MIAESYEVRMPETYEQWVAEGRKPVECYSTDERLRLAAEAMWSLVKTAPIEEDLEDTEWED